MAKRRIGGYTKTGKTVARPSGVPRFPGESARYRTARHKLLKAPLRLALDVLSLPLLDDNLILTLNEAAGVLPCSDVPERDVARYRAKERNPRPDEHRNASDNEALDEPVLEKPLNRDSAIHVNVPDAASREL